MPGLISRALFLRQFLYLAMLRATILFILYVISFECCLAQTFNYVTYTQRDGLAGNMVYDMCQDDEGFLWFGTDNGLSRFDGKNFVNYTVKDGLMDNEVLHFKEDGFGRIWIGTFSHDLLYYFEGKFHNKHNDTMLARVSPNSRPIAYYFTSDSSIWIICQNQIFYWPKDGELVEYNLNSILKRDIKKNNISLKQFWLGSESAFSYNDSLYIIKGNQINYYSTIQIKSGYRLLRFLKREQDSACISIDYDVLRTLNKNNIPFLVSTVNGAYEIDTLNYNIKQRFLPNKAITCAIQDKEGNYWFSTLGDGVYKLASKSALIYSITNQLSAVNEVFCISERNDSILTGHSGGQLAIWKQGKLMDVISFQQYLPKVDNSLSTNRLKAIIPLNNGAWLMGFDGFLIYQKGKTRKFLPMTATKTIDLVNDSIAIVATGQDVKEVNLNSFTVSKVLWPLRATCAVSWNGNTMIGTLGGVKVVENETISAKLQKELIFQRRIISLNKYKSSLWVATSDSGLVELTMNGIGRTLSEKDGLPSNNCRSVYIDGDIMWVGTNKGLARVKLASPTFEILIFNQFNLLPNDAISSVFAKGQEVFVGSPNGLTIFEPAKAVIKSICGLSIDGIVGSKRMWDPDSLVVLRANDNFLQIKFAGISATSAGNIDYYFSLRGLDDKWNHTVANEITFSNLPPGNYTFQLYAQNKFGVKSDVKSIEIEVKAPFYKTRWFLVLLLLIGFGLIYLVSFSSIKYKHKKAESLNKVQRQIAELEQKALQAQMNPHFIFNSLNSIQQYLVTNNLENANKYLSIFSSLIRETLENSALSYISIDKEIQYLEKYLQLEQLRFGNKFSFQISRVSVSEFDDLQIPVMLIQPYVENAVRHGMRYRIDGKGLILIEFSLKDNVLHCFIRDNGPGRKATMRLHSKQHIEYQSKGMNLTEKRIALLNVVQGEQLKVHVEDLIDESGGVCGTLVHLEIPQPENILHDKNNYSR